MLTEWFISCNIVWKYFQKKKIQGLVSKNLYNNPLKDHAKINNQSLREHDTYREPNQSDQPKQT